MSLRKTENQVKDLLTETILALCRNTLNQYADVSVEGLLGVTLDKQEIFLVSINQQIECKKSGDSNDFQCSESPIDATRKRTNDDEISATSASNSDENAEDEGGKTKRKRRRKRRSRSNSNDSCSSNEVQRFEAIELSEIQKTSFLSEHSHFNIDNVNDTLASEPGDQSLDLSRLAESSQNLAAENDRVVGLLIKEEVAEDNKNDTGLVIKQEKRDEDRWPSSWENLTEHSRPSGLSALEKSSSNHAANMIPLSDTSEDAADHSMSEQTGPGPSACASNSGAGDVYVPKLFYDGAANSLPIFRSGSHDASPSQNQPHQSTQQPQDSQNVLGNLQMANAAGFMSPLAQVSLLSPGVNQALLTRSMLESFSPVMWQGKHICPFCHKIFAAPNQVRRHIVVHTGEKNYECEICGARFGQKATAKSHRRRIHGLDD